MDDFCIHQHCVGLCCWYSILYREWLTEWRKNGPEKHFIGVNERMWVRTFDPASAHSQAWKCVVAGLKVRGRSCERTHSQLGNHASNSICAYIREWLKVYTWRAEGILLRGLTYIRAEVYMMSKSVVQGAVVPFAGAQETWWIVTLCRLRWQSYDIGNGGLGVSES